MIRTWSRASRRILPITRSQCAFTRGARGALKITSRSSASKTASDAAPYVSSRSRGGNRSESVRLPGSAARFRACRTARARVGWAVTPVRCRRRVPCSRNASTYRRLPRTVSRWKKSAAMIPSAWAVRNARQPGPERRGAGSMPGSIEDLPHRGGGDRVPGPGRFALDSSVPPPWILPGQAEGGLLERGFGGWAAGSAASGGVVPLRHDRSAVPSRQGPRGDREDRSPAAAGGECGQCREPEPVRGLVAHRLLELPTQHRVLVPQHEQPRVPWPCRGAKAPSGRTAASGSSCTATARSLVHDPNRP